VYGADVPGLAIIQKDEISSLLALILFQLFGNSFPKTGTLAINQNLSKLFVVISLFYVSITYSILDWWHWWQLIS
jgi:hypothetical protein